MVTLARKANPHGTALGLGLVRELWSLVVTEQNQRIFHQFQRSRTSLLRQYIRVFAIL